MVGSRQAEHDLQRVDGRGRYGNFSRQWPRTERERRTDKEGRAASPREL